MDELSSIDGSEGYEVREDEGTLLILGRGSGIMGEKTE